MLFRGAPPSLNYAGSNCGMNSPVSVKVQEEWAAAQREILEQQQEKE